MAVVLALDARSRQVLAFHVGDRSRHSARQLWEKLPAIYRQRATFYTDSYAAYGRVIPLARHRTITKAARKTNHVERFNGTLRQRLSRLVPSALPFSKPLAHHLGAIRHFICDYNLSRATCCGGAKPSGAEHHMNDTTRGQLRFQTPMTTRRRYTSVAAAISP